jgi:chemotaxis protein CheX
VTFVASRTSTVPERTNLIDQLARATEEVFQKMVFKSLVQGSPIEGKSLGPRSNVVALVGFGGSLSGLVAFYTTLEAGEAIARSMLELPDGDARAEVADAIGEVTNMIAGAFRLKLVEQGETVAISIPSVTIGSDFYTKYAPDVRRVLCPFTMDDKEICVELVLTRNR